MSGILMVLQNTFIHCTFSLQGQPEFYGSSWQYCPPAHLHFELTLPLGLGAPLLPAPHIPTVQWIAPQKACQRAFTPCLISQGEQG